MPKDRFFHPSLNSQELILQGDEFHHLSRVMRKNIQDQIELIDGKGSLVLAEILSITPKEAHLQVVSKESHAPPIRQIHLVIPLMPPVKLEWLIEKATELGVDQIHLYTAEYSTIKALSEHKIKRLQSIILSATKQSGRLFFPLLNQSNPLEKICEWPGILLFGAPQGARLPCLPKIGDIFFVTGPEKGFSSKELSLLSQKGTGVSINPHTLRAETAPLAALAIFGYYN